MKVLVVGASGATGRLVVEQLLELKHDIRIVVRSQSDLPRFMREFDASRLEILQAAILDLDDPQLASQVVGCDAVISCLGHNLTVKGLLGHPRRLVTDAVQRICNTISNNRPAVPVKLILMSSAGVVNRDLHEPISIAQRIVLFVLRRLVPPNADNEEAAEYLRTEIGQSHAWIQWCVVRPDSLVNSQDVSDYDIFSSPVRSAIFNSGKTSRINVADLIAKLATQPDVWDRWRGQMPVIYNRIESGPVDQPGN